MDAIGKAENYLPVESVSNLKDAEEFSQQRLLDICTTIKSCEVYKEVECLGLGFAVSGSLGRLEALQASDIDLITLCSEDAPENEARRVDQAIREIIRTQLNCDVSKGENFTGPTYLRDIASTKRIGGGEDNVNLLTKRILLLTECRSIANSKALNHFQSKTLDAFFYSPETKRRYLISLADEIVRYYRTLCVDYKSRVDWEGKAWAPRYLKLRHSRKYWFFSIVIGMSALLVRCETVPEAAEAEIGIILNQSPTERIVTALEYAGMPSQLATVAFYNRFLGKMRDKDVRKSLEDVEYGSRHQYEIFEDLKRNADRLHRAMLETFESLPASWRRHIYSRFLLHS